MTCSLDKYSTSTKLTGKQKTHTGTYNVHWLVVHNNVHWYSTHNSSAINTAVHNTLQYAKKYTELCTTHAIVHTHIHYNTYAHTLHYMYCTLHTHRETHTLYYTHNTHATLHTHIHTLHYTQYTQ